MPHTVSQFASIRCPPWVSTLSGWNCTPWMGSSRCFMAITMPLSVCAVTWISAGIVSGSTVSEWYLVAVNGLGRPARTPSASSSWVTNDVLPCSSSGARSTVAPKAAPIAWWPRQTPSKGVPWSAAAFTKGMVAPAR